MGPLEMTENKWVAWVVTLLEDHPSGCKLVNNHGDRFCPLRIGLWDPFQIAMVIR